MLPNYSTMKEKMNGLTMKEAQMPVILYKQLLEAAEACEVRSENPSMPAIT